MKKYLLGALALVLISTFALVAIAQEWDPGEVSVSNYIPLRIRTSPQGMTILERAVLIQQRIVEALSYEDVEPANIYTVVRNQQIVIMAGNTMLVTVDQDTAAANGTTPEILAQIWLANLRTALPAAKPVPLPFAF